MTALTIIGLLAFCCLLGAFAAAVELWTERS
jgi:hypothetical protein